MKTYNVTMHWTPWVLHVKHKTWVRTDIDPHHPMKDWFRLYICPPYLIVLAYLDVRCHHLLCYECWMTVLNIMLPSDECCTSDGCQADCRLQPDERWMTVIIRHSTDFRLTSADTSHSCTTRTWDTSDPDSTFIQHWLDLRSKIASDGELSSALSSFFGHFHLIRSHLTRQTLTW